MEESDRLFNPSRESIRILKKITKIGPAAKTLSEQMFERGGRLEQKALYALSNLTRHHTCDEIDAACLAALKLTVPRYQDIKRILKHGTAKVVAENKNKDTPSLKQSGEGIRSTHDYQLFFELHTTSVH
jgi:hypothetical protein